MALLKPFEVFLVTFLTFLLYAALTEQQIVRDFARGLSYANFVKNDKSKLDTQQLASLRARTSAECKWKCLLNNNCFSLNYGGQGVGEKMCQLLTANKFESSTKMTIDENFQHFSVAVSCASFSLVISESLNDSNLFSTVACYWVTNVKASLG